MVSLRKRCLNLMIVFCVLLLSASLVLIKDVKSNVVSADAVKETKQKIVSVLFDDSGSMTSYADDKSASRYDYAMYATQMLMSTLNENDELYFTTLNKSNTLTFNLAAVDRNAEIKKFLTNNKDFFYPTPYTTPIKNLEKARQVLIDRGMKKTEDIFIADETKEYWLFILTDGNFTNPSNQNYSAAEVEEIFTQKLSGYSNLQNIYASFGAGAVDFTKSPLNNNLISAYIASDSNEVVSMMLDIANRVTDRYAMDKNKGDFTISGNKVIVNVKDKFSLKSIAVIAQDCGVELVKAVYDGNDLPIKNGSVIDTYGINLKNGYSAVINASPYFMGKNVELIFSGDVGDKVSVLAEPALDIKITLERKEGDGYVATDANYINANLIKGDVVRANYVIIDQVSGNEINADNLFGTQSSVVTYNNKNYKSGEDITLETGKLELGVTVKIEDDNCLYTLHDSVLCIVEPNPTYFRLEKKIYEGVKDGLGKDKAKVVYTVFYDNVALNSNLIKDYTFDVKVKDEKGEDCAYNSKINSQGQLEVYIDLSSKEYGEYYLSTRATAETGIFREDSQTIVRAPSAVNVKLSGVDNISMSQNQSLTNIKSFSYLLEADGEPFNFDENIVSYSVKIASVDVTAYAKINGNELTITPTADVMGAEGKTIGEKAVVVEVTIKTTFGSIKNSCSAKLNLTPTIYEINLVDEGDNSIDIYKLNDCKAVLYYQVLRDGESLSLEEIENCLSDGTIQLTFDKFGWVNPLPCGVETKTELLNGTPVISVRVFRDWIRPLDNLFASFIFKDVVEIKGEYNGDVIIGEFEFLPVSFTSRIIRWVIIAIIIIIILYICVYVAGFFIRKTLPYGVLVTIPVGFSPTAKVRVDRREINKMSTRVKWHLKRLIPFFILNDQDAMSTGPYFTLMPTMGVRGAPRTRTNYFKVKKEVYKAKFRGSRTFKELIETYKRELTLWVNKSGIKSQFSKKLDMTNADLKDIIKAEPRNLVKRDSVVDCTSEYYAEFNDKGELKKLIFFVPANKK